MRVRPIVALVAHDVGGRGGMERHLCELVGYLKRDYLVVVVSVTCQLEDMDGVRFIRIPVPKRPAALKIILFSILASIRLLFLRYDILHTTGAIVWNRADVCTVHFCHAAYLATGTFLAEDAKSRLHRLNWTITTQLARGMEAIQYRPSRTRHLVGVSRRVRQELLRYFRYPDEAVTVIRNGLNREIFYVPSEERKSMLRTAKSLPQNLPIVLFMGGNWRQKGLGYVVDAFSRLPEEKSGAHLVVVGAGNPLVYQARLSLSQQERVHFVGPQSDPQDWFALADVFILPSSYETFSLVIHEAAASGLVILATDVGGVDEWLRDGETGFVVARDANEIARTMHRVLQNLDAYRPCGQRARQAVESLTWECTYKAFRQLYQQVLNHHLGEELGPLGRGSHRDGLDL